MNNAIATVLYILISTIAVFVTGRILPGVRVDDFTTALLVAVVLGVINAFIRPLLILLTLPINILTMGLFTLVIMGFCAWLTSLIVPGLYIANFWWAIGFAVVLAIINAFFNAIVF